MGPLVWLFWPTLQMSYIALIFPLWLALTPCLWLYVEALTSPYEWRPKARHGYHFIPLAFGLVLAASILLLPAEVSHRIFFEDVDIESGFPLAVVIGLFLSIVFWALQSSYYAMQMLTRLWRFRLQLKALFSNNENRELIWIHWLLIVFGTLWVLAIVSLVMTLTTDVALFEHRVGAFLLLILVWTLGFWGLRQRPGFEGRYLDQNQQQELLVETDKDSHKKYQRSALSAKQAQRIANKISAAMENEHMHLDPNLTLSKLALILAISPNYISQTLNETMGTTFFDYVNHWRIHFAKPKILANTDSVLNIALEAGFNARSSFYKAFKQETGFTPTEYRKRYSGNA